MIIRIVDILIIVLIVGFSAWWLLNTYVLTPRKQSQQELETNIGNAIEKAEVDYLEIRKSWMGFYNLGKNQEFYADAMDDITIPEVAKFQRVMVSLNQEYNDLKAGKKPDETFVGKALLLRSLFDDAVLAAKKHSLS